MKGLTRDVLVALVANIETTEWRRAYNHANGIPSEHPRASTTDDVECFFSLLRNHVGHHETGTFVHSSYYHNFEHYTGLVRIIW